MILGTGAYKRGLAGTAYRPELDAGWGICTGIAEPGPVRSYFPNPAENAAIVARATVLRGGQVVGADGDPVPAARDLLDDVIRVWAHIGRPGVHWRDLAQLLAREWPEFYTGLTPEAVSTLLRDRGVPSVDVKVDGQVLKGCRREAVAAALEARQLVGGR